MGKLFIMMGKSATGKDTVYERVMERCQWLEAVVPYTTRPIREGETEGKEYHFATEEQLRGWEDEGKVIECRCYQTVHGPWYYFTLDDGSIDFSQSNYAMITTLEGYEKIQAYYSAENVVPVYLVIDDFTRLERALGREKTQKNPCVAEVCRRFLADEADFAPEKLGALGILEPIVNEELEDTVEKVEKYIADHR